MKSSEFKQALLSALQCREPKVDEVEGQERARFQGQLVIVDGEFRDTDVAVFLANIQPYPGCVAWVAVSDGSWPEIKVVNITISTVGHMLP